MTALMLAVTTFAAVPVTADSTETAETTAAQSSGQKTFSYEEQNTYSDYYDEISGSKRPDKEAFLTYKGARDGAQVSVESYEGKDNIVVWSNEEGTLDFTVNVPETGAYNIGMSYYQITGSTTTTEFSVLIDGESPYDTATRINIPRIWTSKYPIAPDAKDNEIRPPQVEMPMWTTTSFKDEDGLFNEPLLFYLEAGEHTISISSERAMVAIEYIKLCNEKGYDKYVKPSDDELAKNASAEPIKVQGERYTYTNSQTLFPTYDRGNYLTEPSNPTKQRYNTVGDGT